MVPGINRRQACLQLAATACATTAAGAAMAAATGATIAPVAVAGEGARWLPWPVGLSTPRIALPDVDGAPWSLAQQAGRPVLLNFWASWCEPCRAELPSLALLAQQFRPQGLLVVALNFKESADTVRRVRDAQGASLLWLRDTYGETTRAWGVRSFPTTVLVDRQGRAVVRVQGEVDWAEAGVQQRLAALW